MLIFVSKTLNIEGWHLMLTAIGVVAPIILALIAMDKSRKRDLKDELSKKADKEELKILHKRVDKIDTECKERAKELKEDFIKQVQLLNQEFDDKFTLLLKEIMKLMKEKKDK